MSPLATTPTNRPNGSLTSGSNRGVSSSLTTLNNNGGWSATCLRPPLRPCLALGSTQHGSPARLSNRKTLSHNDDAQILKVIEAYCTSTRPKNTISTDHKLQGTSKSTENSGKPLGDIVKSLQENVQDLHRSIGVLLLQLTEERLARSALQNIIKTHLAAGKDFENIPWPPCEQ